MLTLITPPAALPVPANVLADHLHLNTAAPELDETGTLERLIRAATAAIERRIQGALIMQGWRWRLAEWREALPLSPVAGVESVEIVDDGGTATPWDGWLLSHAAPQRLLARMGEVRPSIPRGGHAEIVFTAGYGLGWTDVPEDLRHAVTLLAAHYYEHREAAGAELATLPHSVDSLIAPYRPIRL